jgi:hypothetical protein
MKSGLICNPSTQESGSGGSQIPGQPGLHSETLSQKQNKTKKEKDKEKTCMPA